MTTRTLNQEAILQALTRLGRVVAAYAIAQGLVALPAILAGFNLDPITHQVVVGIVTAILNALGKLVRGPDIPVEPYEDVAVTDETRGGRVIPVERRVLVGAVRGGPRSSWAWFLPI